MNKIIDYLMENNFLRNKVVTFTILIFAGLHSLLTIFIILDTLFDWKIFNDISGISSIYNYMGLLIFLLTFVVITRKGKEDYIERVESDESISMEILRYLNKKGTEFTRKEILSNKEFNGGEKFDGTNFYVLYGDSSYPIKRRKSLFGFEDAVVDKVIGQDDKYIINENGKKYLKKSDFLETLKEITNKKLKGKEGYVKFSVSRASGGYKDIFRGRDFNLFVNLEEGKDFGRFFINLVEGGELSSYPAFKEGEKSEWLNGYYPYEKIFSGNNKDIEKTFNEITKNLEIEK